MVVALVLLVGTALAVATCVALHAAQRSGVITDRSAWTVLALSVFWLGANGPVEGAVLWTLTADRGLTVADLLAAPAAALLLRWVLEPVLPARRPVAV